MSAFKRRKIRSQKTVGQKLALARRRQKLSIEAVEEATRIRSRYLEAIEKDDYRHLPSPVYLVGFLSSYAELFELPPEEIIKQYKKERGVQPERHHHTTVKPISELEKQKISITPKTIIWASALLVVLTLFGYLGWQWKKFSSPPPIEVLSPTSEEVSADKIVLKAVTSETAEVTINGHGVSVDDSGSFKQEISLRRGVNTIEIMAKNRMGRETVKTLKIFADF